MMFEDFKKLILAEFPETTDEQLSRFCAMEGLYREWNAKINVISRKDIDSFYEHHVLHSLGIASFWKREGIVPAPGTTVLDLGTGGGFPGIPLAVLFPQLDFTLCDSIGKKILVAGGVASSLGLDNVKTVNARAESLPGSFDYVVSRAVTSLDNFYPWVKGKYGKGIFYLKGGDINPEIATLMQREHLRQGSVHTWRIDNWLEDEYFSEKFVIYIEN